MLGRPDLARGRSLPMSGLKRRYKSSKPIAFFIRKHKKAKMCILQISIVKQNVVMSSMKKRNCGYHSIEILNKDYHKKIPMPH